MTQHDERIGSVREARTTKTTTTDRPVTPESARSRPAAEREHVLDRPHHHDDRSIGGLLRDLRDQTTELLRQEFALARTEMREKFAVVGRNIAFLIVGSLIAVVGIVWLLAAATAAIGAALIAAGVADETAAWLAPLILGVVVGIAGYALVHKAIATLRDTHLTPEKTVQSLKENARWLENKTP